MACFPTNWQSCLSLVLEWGGSLEDKSHTLKSWPTPSIYRASTSLPAVDCFSCLGLSKISFNSREGSFLKDPRLVLGDFCPDVSNSNIFIYEFRTSHINFIQKNIKLNETCQDKQGRYKATLLNVIDILGPVTSKLHETWQTFYKKYNNSY